MSVQACATQRFNLQSNVDAEPSYHTSDGFFVGGIGQTKKRFVPRVCGGVRNVGAVEYKSGAFNSIINVMSAGLYAPRDYLVYCK
ncbi:MAG: lipoprotein bor [Alphaproteobacteria bacterium GM202ARS2]|nr:lipoprotein bor [Alphaproteobacteria bacterium GM202ARS2]